MLFPAHNICSIVPSTLFVWPRRVRCESAPGILQLDVVKSGLSMRLLEASPRYTTSCITKMLCSPKVCARMKIASRINVSLR